jgi:hypothetical protein
MPGTGGDQVIQETAYPERQIRQVLKAMSGLRQSPKLFQEHLAVQLQSLGFLRLLTDTSTYSDDAGQVDLVVHIDDLISAGPTKQIKKHLAALHAKFAMKTTGLLTKEGEETSVLGRTLERTAKGYILHSDSKLVTSVIKDLGIEQAKPAATPGIKDEPEQAEPLGPEAHRRYRTLVGRLLYMSLDRADIQYAVKELSRQLHAPTEHSMVKLKRLGRYLVGRPTSALRFEVESRPDVLEVWVDADWGGNSNQDRRSTSGGMVLLGGAPLLTWSRTQQSVALSSGESEYYAITSGAVEGLGLVNLLAELGLSVRLNLLTDSAAAKKAIEKGRAPA